MKKIFSRKKHFSLAKFTRTSKAHIAHCATQALGTTMSHLRQNVADFAECTTCFPVGIKVASAESMKRRQNNERKF